MIVTHVMSISAEALCADRAYTNPVRSRIASVQGPTAAQS